MIQILEKLKRASYNRKTYRVGLLQAKAYRILKSRTTKILEPFDISTIEWAFLGLLYDKASLRTKVAARELGVEAPFITALVSSLKKRSFVVEAKIQTINVPSRCSLATKVNYLWRIPRRWSVKECVL